MKMNKTSRRIIKSLLASAVLSLFHSESKAEVPALPSLDDFGNSNAEELDIMKQKVFKHVIKLKPDGTMIGVDSHRSHSSHRSHASHRSSRSGHSSHYSSSHYSSSHYSSSSGTASGLYSTPKPAAKTYKTYSLGDRTLKRGLYGKDVNELVSKLQSNYYLRNDFSATQSDYYLFNQDVERAVKQFQKDAKIKETGIVGETELSLLGTWNSSKSTLVLGVRDLKQNDSGADVLALIELLNKAGFPPEPEKLDGNKYNEEVRKAVKTFQAFAGLEVTGIADRTTIERLKASAK